MKVLSVPLIYASFITVLLKRLMAYSTEALKSLWIFTQKTARTAYNWLFLLVVHVGQGLPMMTALSECIDTIAKLCERAHPKRNLKDGLYQSGVMSLVNI
jgi:hypothetical protein